MESHREVVGLTHTRAKPQRPCFGLALCIHRDFSNCHRLIPCDALTTLVALL